uniref:Coiled-coil domain-containing protein 40 n=1 Tax=Clastoptera arizonana TaxID=38151 RepID=A0A1B6C4I5_9HEMI
MEEDKEDDEKSNASEENTSNEEAKQSTRLEPNIVSDGDKNYEFILDNNSKTSSLESDIQLKPDILKENETDSLGASNNEKFMSEKYDINEELSPIESSEFQIEFSPYNEEILSDHTNIIDQESEYVGSNISTDKQIISKDSIEENKSLTDIESKTTLFHSTVNIKEGEFSNKIFESAQSQTDEKNITVKEEPSQEDYSYTIKSILEESHPSLSDLDLEITQACCEDITTTQQPEMDGEIDHQHPDFTITPPENMNPDNHLMKRFQIALNAHLQRQKSRIAAEILEMEGDFRLKKKQREEVATFLYNTQQALSKQHKILEKDKCTIMNHLNNRQDLEHLFLAEKAKHIESFDLLESYKKKMTTLQLEKESLAATTNQLSELEEKLNSEITISQMVSDKNKADKKHMSLEKLKQDMLLVRLTSEVLRLSSMFNELEKNIKDKQSYLQTIIQAVSDGSFDLETLESENKRLTQVWKVVIFRIQQRDKAYVDLKAELLKAQNQYKSIICQIDSFKRSTFAEIKSNEHLTHALNRMEFDIETLERQFTVEADKQRKFNEMLAQAVGTMELTQQELNSALLDFAIKEKEDKLLQRDIDSMMLKKYKVEDQILNLLQSQMVNSKIESYANRHIRQLHIDCREQEILKKIAENSLAKNLFKIEHESKAIKERQSLLDKEQALERDRDKEIESMEVEFTHLVRAISSKQSRIDAINTKVAEIMLKNGDIVFNPEELLIKQVEKKIIETNNLIEDLKLFWIREQSYIVSLQQQRTNQLLQLNISGKQVLIMEQKYLKLDQEIEKYRKDENNLKRKITSLDQKLTFLNEQFSQHKGFKEELGNGNYAMQNQLICDIKDAEITTQLLQTEKCQMEIDKEELRKQLIETQREMLAWEKKVKLAAETKQSLEKAKCEGGEIAVMKSEIHRMEVRCAQLHKVQEKLAQDMEMCVSRRDGIVDLAYAREKRSINGAHYTRQQFNRKIDEIRNKIRQVISETKSVEKSFISAEGQLSELNARVVIGNEQLNGLQEAVTNMETELDEGHLHRQKNLELLVRRQRKARLYGEVKGGRYSMIFKNESTLELESQKQRTINADLVLIVESLSTDFPSLDNPLTQVLNTLRSPSA